jgi:dolichol-phosphate mannosyltransferase
VLERLVLPLQKLPLPRVVKFAIVGASGVFVNLGMLWTLHGALEMPIELAALIAIELSILSNLLINDIWTFHDERNRPFWARAVGAHTGSLLAVGINYALLIVLNKQLDVYYLAAAFLSIAAGAGVNYSVSALWTWRPAAPSPRAVNPQTEPGKIVVVVPTYNEAANIQTVIDRVLGLGPQYELLVVDDASPDGTAELITKQAQTSKRLHLIRRPEKLGIGTAYVDGFRTALCLGADLIVQMDCDLSHSPADVPRLVEASRETHVVVGSRYVEGGRAVDWPWYREFISRATGLTYRALLGVPVRDLTGGFKCWRREVLESLPLEEVGSKGFAFQIEMNYLTWRAGYSIREVPVTFVEREHGQSKMSFAISVEAARLLWRLSFSTPPAVQAERVSNR